MSDSKELMREKNKQYIRKYIQNHRHYCDFCKRTYHPMSKFYHLKTKKHWTKLYNDSPVDLLGRGEDGTSDCILCDFHTTDEEDIFEHLCLEKHIDNFVRKYREHIADDEFIDMMRSIIDSRRRKIKSECESEPCTVDIIFKKLLDQILGQIL